MPTIDRIKGKWAVIIHDEQIINLPRSLLPNDAKEGDVIQIVVDHRATANRKKRAGSLLDNFFDE